MKVLKATTGGFGQDAIATLLVDHQWLGPYKPGECLCGAKNPHGTKNHREAHAAHVANTILEEL